MGLHSAARRQHKEVGGPFALFTTLLAGPEFAMWTPLFYLRRAALVALLALNLSLPILVNVPCVRGAVAGWCVARRVCQEKEEEESSRRKAAKSPEDALLG